MHAFRRLERVAQYSKQQWVRPCPRDVCRVLAEHASRQALEHEREHRAVRHRRLACVHLLELRRREPGLPFATNYRERTRQLRQGQEARQLGAALRAPRMRPLRDAIVIDLNPRIVPYGTG